MTDTSHDSEQMDRLQRAALALKRMRAKLDALEHARVEPIAIIGIGCRLPGATANVCGPESFWDLLQSGTDAISEVPPERWDSAEYYDPNPDAPGKLYTRWGGFLRGIDRFDAALFGIAPREASSIDPQQRLLLEVAWEALEHAGQAPDMLKKTPTGVFIGIGIGDYGNMQLRPGHTERIDAYTGTGTGFCFASGRLSYILGAQGPSFSVDTACSSSLVALHLACQSLRSQECRIALAGGVNAMLAPEAMLFLAKSRALSPTGRCRTFDAAADGFVRGEGCGILALKRLQDAVADGDTVLAVIVGSGINHDGPSSGLTVPNGQAQQSLLRQVLEQSRIEASQIDYVETHGTGTSLGDPIEVRALGAVLGAGRSRATPLLIGSVKTNIGHLEAAAGVVGVIKAVLALQHATIPAHLHFQSPSPHIPWSELPIAVPTTPTPWPRQPDKRRIAGVSSFGLSGTNAHLLVADGPDQAEPEVDQADGVQILGLSAKSEAALRALASRYEAYLAAQPNVALPDLCFTANTGRAYLTHHLAAIAASPDTLRRQLAAFAAGKETLGLVSGQTRDGRRPKIAFLCTGQGSQYAGMGQQLYATEPVFRQALDQCDALLRPHLGQSLLAVLHPDSPSSASIDDTFYTQPALFALEYALAQLWQAWGVTPSVVLGHSVGEYAAACIAGVFSLEDGLRLVVERARLMRALPPGGAMFAVQASAAQVRPVIEPYAGTVSIAALNGPEHVVISGQQRFLEAVTAELSAQGIKTRQLTVSHAFHSPLMQPILADFARAARSARYAPPKIDIIANLTGELATAQIATPDYWIEHVLQPVHFAASIQTLQRRGYEVCIEIGPQPVLLGMARQNQPAADGNDTPWLWLPSLRQSKPDAEQILESLAALHANGARIDWQSFYADQRRRKIALPTYPFQQQRYWFEAAPEKHARDHAAQQLPGRRIYSPLFTKGEIQFALTIDRQTRDLVEHDAAAGLLTLRDDGYTKIALAAGKSALQGAEAAVSELSIRQALAFAADAAPTLQIVLTPDADSAYSLQILSLAASDGSAAPVWTCHAVGKIVPVQADRLPPEWERWLYTTSWQPGLPAARSTTTAAGSWLILADQGGVGQKLADLLQAQGDTCTLVHAGTAYAAVAKDRYTADPASPGDFRRLIEEWAGQADCSRAGVVHLWSLDTPLTPDLPAASLEHAQRLSCGSALHLTQALAQMSAAAPPELWLVTRGSQAVGGSGLPQPQHTTLWGLSYVIGLENPELRLMCLDLDPQAPERDPQHLLEELQLTDRQQRIAYREGLRYTAQLDRYRPPEHGSAHAAAPIPIQPQSTYLITGGLGALGLGVARWMIRQGADTLVLLGRRAPAPEAQAAVAALEERGARILVMQADVANADDVRSTLDRIAGQLPPLRGVVHAAGVLDDATLAQQTWERFRAVLAPKAAGAWNLHLLTQSMPLDFFVSFSSIASIFGSPGQGNYSAANAFLDGLAHYRHMLGLPATTINWGPWAGDGMESANHERRAAQGLGLIEPEHGFEILGRLMQQPLSQVTVVPVRWEQFLDQLLPSGLTSFCRLFQATTGDSLAPQPSLREQLAALPLSQRRSWLAGQVRSIAAQVLGIGSAEEIPPRQGLFELGLDSLMALELKHRLALRTGAFLGQTFVFDYPMIDSMVDYLSRQVFPELFQRESYTAADRRRAESALTADLMQISDAEAEALLIAELEKLNR